MFGLGMFSGNFVSGMMEERDRLAGERLRVARAFDEFKRNNPYATMDEFRSFADQVSGGDSYLRGRFPTDEVMQRLADDNQRRRTMDDAQRQAQVLNTELQVDEALQRTLRRNVLNSGDPMRAIEETVNAFARDPASREQLRGRVMSSVGDPSAFFTRVQFEESERVMPSVLNALRQGIDITPFVQGLPESVRTQVQSRARDIIGRERAEDQRRTNAENAQRMVAFETAMIQRFGPLLLDPNNQDLVRRQVGEAAQTFGLNLDQPAIDRVVGAVRASQDASVFSINQNLSQAQRLRGAELADREITDFRDLFLGTANDRFANNDPRRGAAQNLVRSYFLTPAERTAALNWLGDQRVDRNTDAGTLANGARDFLQSQRGGQPLPSLDAYRQRRSSELGGGVLPPPVQYGGPQGWSTRTQREITRIMEAFRPVIEREAANGNHAEAAAVERRASAELSRVLRDIQARAASPGATFIPSGGAPNMGEIAAFERAATEGMATLRALVPQPQPVGTPAPQVAARPQPQGAPRMANTDAEVDRVLGLSQAAERALSEASRALDEHRRTAPGLEERRRNPNAVREYDARERTLREAYDRAFAEASRLRRGELPSSQ